MIPVAHFEDVSSTVGWPLPVPEGVINKLAYEALSAAKTEDAIALFKRNVRAHTSSANAHDGLADAYEKAGNWIEAVGASQHAAKVKTRFEQGSQHE